ncbi:hypothetical protein Ct61P_01578 [Colletotrichum tofieldiae]|nr:hypothetical protein Ct61P_01578 [Colletotrichum tofieldiae]
MKNLLLVLTGVTALATTGTAMSPHDGANDALEVIAGQEHHDSNVGPAKETITLRRRECEIACPIDRRYCYYSPYNYKCDRHGKLQWSQRDIDCEQPTSGCWCGCDWRAPGIEKKGVSGSAGEA